MSDWYQENIEPEVRDLVKYLRNNGINTTCSCGHEGYVECDYDCDGEIKRLHDLLYYYFAGDYPPFREPNYKIEVRMVVEKGLISQSCIVITVPLLPEAV